ncbi:MAG: hypothetical protein P8123_01230 [bacterium]
MKKIIFKAMGPVSVIYYRDEDKWIAHALQFNLMGSGSTQEAAFDDLQGLFSHYFIEYCKRGNFSTFLSPAERRYWNIQKYPQEHYVVMINVVATKITRPFLKHPDLKHVPTNRIAKYFKEVSLEPAI